jgi:hypothetical protein
MKYIFLLAGLIATGFLYTNCSAGFQALSSTSASNSLQVNTAEQVKNANALFASLGFSPGLTLANPTHPFPAGFGTAHARPRYNPYGTVQNALLDGAIDAYNLGFQTFKFWNGPEVKLDPSFYFLSEAERAKLSDFSSALDLNIYKAVLAIPFRTVVFESDDVVFMHMTEAPLTQTEKDRIYKSTYDFTARLRRDFNGSRRTFIIQNHEADWHITQNPGSAAIADDPTSVGLDNYRQYWTLRQRAIEAARAANPSDAQVYQLCEVVRTKPSIERNAPSLTRDVLPGVACDLVGYSSYETALQATPDEFERSLAYIREHAKASPTFGKNQVVISEIGLAENNASFTQATKDNVIMVMKRMLESGMPYVLFWTMYDNECNLAACSGYGGITSNVPQADLAGFYVRKPDRSFSYIFSGLVQLFKNDGADLSDARATALVQCYRTSLGRAPDITGFNFWYGNNALSMNAICAEIKNSPEATIRNCYLKNLGREPDREGLRYWLGVYDKKQATLDSICASIRE